MLLCLKIFKNKSISDKDYFIINLTFYKREKIYNILDIVMDFVTCVLTHIIVIFLN